MYPDQSDDVNGDRSKNSTYRVGKRHKPFAQLANTMLRDPNLALDERGTLALMLSYPENWKFWFSWLCKETGAGREKMRRILNNLEQRGYLTREQCRNADGTFAIIYTITDEPAVAASGSAGDGSPTTGSPVTGKPPVAQPVVGHPPAARQAHKNTDEKDTESRNTEIKHTGEVVRARAADDCKPESMIGKSSSYRPNRPAGERQQWVEHLAGAFASGNGDDTTPRKFEYDRATEMLNFVDRVIAIDTDEVLHSRLFARDGLHDLVFTLLWDYSVETVAEVVTEVIERENSKADVTTGKIKSWSYFTQAVEEFEDLAGDDEEDNHRQEFFEQV